jgi:uracil-DNA glycosylase family 4
MDTWQDLKNECLGCQNCPLGQTRTNLVFGDGAADAKIMLIGEGPGQREDEQGVPFVGPAGKLLDDMLAIIGLDRTKVYVANIVKCRPPHNRDPLQSEQEACIGWLRRQQALLQPKIQICLGRIAAGVLIKPDFKITREHGVWFDCGGVETTAIYHPSALLRDPDKRPETFEDLKAIQMKIQDLCPEIFTCRNDVSTGGKAFETA